MPPTSGYQDSIIDSSSESLFVFAFWARFVEGGVRGDAVLLFRLG
jgi:hypothetical protein